MEAATAIGRWRGAHVDFLLPVWLARSCAVASLGLFGLLGLLVCARRATGALEQPLSPLWLVGLAVALAAVALLFRKAFVAVPLSPAMRSALWAAPSVVLALWAIGISLEASNAAGLGAFFGTFLLEEGWSWGRLRHRFDAPRSGPAAVPAPHLTAASLATPHAESIDDAVDVADTCQPDGSVTQQVTRRREESGQVLEGWLRVDFVVGQRHAAAHVAICPPFDRLPECYVEQADGPSAQVKVGQVLAHGARFEIKLDVPAEEASSVIVEFSIQEGRPQD